MQTLALIVGVILIVMVVVDALWTTVAAAGAGPLTRRLSRGLWSLALAGHRRTNGHRLLAVMGPVILMSAIVLWILMLWAGYLLVFGLEYNAVVSASTNEPAGVWERIYFTGFTISTLGMGDYVPQGAGWHFLAAFASLNGLFLATLSITYLVSVLSAVAAKRQIASMIADVGKTPSTILERAWNDAGDFKLENVLTQLTPMLELHAQRHLAYPVLHYYHTRHERAAIAPRLAALDEALWVITADAERRGAEPPFSVELARRAIGDVLETLETGFIDTREIAPPSSILKQDMDGMPDIPEETDIERRRRLLRAYVRNDGWEWNHVTTRHESTSGNLWLE